MALPLILLAVFAVNTIVNAQSVFDITGNAAMYEKGYLVYTDDQPLPSFTPDEDPLTLYNGATQIKATGDVRVFSTAKDST